MSSVPINKSKSVLNIISHHLGSNEVELCVENFRSPGRSIKKLRFAKTKKSKEDFDYSDRLQKDAKFGTLQGWVCILSRAC